MIVYYNKINLISTFIFKNYSLLALLLYPGSVSAFKVFYTALITSVSKTITGSSKDPMIEISVKNMDI